MADARSELEELRRLEELERKASGGAAFVTPKQRATPVTPEVKERVQSLSERAGEYLFGEPERQEFSIPEVGGAAAVGAGAGFAAPKVLEKGGRLVSKLPLPYAKTIGNAAEALGTAMGRIPVMQRTWKGGLGGAAGSAAEQTAELAGAPKAVSIPVGFGVGGVTPELENAIKKLVTKVGSVAFGSEGMTTAIMRDLKAQGIDVTPKIAQLIEKEVNAFRQADKGKEPQEALFTALRTGAADITSEASKRAGAKVAEGQMTADQIRNFAQYQADQVLRNAQQQSQKIRDSARAMSPQMRQKAESDAQSVLSQGQAEANRIQQEASNRVAELRSKAGKLTTRAESGKEEAQKTIQAIGQPKKPTDIGNDIRKSVEPIFETLKSTRDANAKIAKTEAFSEALAKEQAGQRVSETKAFKDAIAKIQNAITNPDTKLTNVSINEVKGQLNKVKSALDPRELDPVTGVATGKPVSFEALENLRRFLRDRSYGLPAQGFDAIGQRQAGELAEAVEKIQREFSPKIGKFLEQYKADSEPLRIFKTKLGQALVGKEEFDMARFVTDPAELSDKFFKSETGVKDMMQLLGKDFMSVIGSDVKNAEQIARSYIANKLQGASAKDVQKVLSDSSDWIDQFPALKQQLQNAATTMGRAEGFGGARSKLAQALRTEAGGLPIKAAQESEAVLSKAAREAKQAEQQRIKTAATGLKGEKKLAAGVVKGAEAEAKGILQAAETPAEQAIKEARAAGQQITQEAEQRVKTILGSQFPNEEIEKLMLGGDLARWSEVAPIFARSQEGKQNIEQAVRQVMSRVSPRSMGDTFRDTVRQRLETTRLISPQKLDEIQSQLDYISNLTLTPEQRMSLLQRITRNILTTIPATTVGAPAGAILGEE